jgi:hypothetical protein
MSSIFISSIFIYYYPKELLCGFATSGESEMAGESKEVSSGMVVGIGIVIFIVIVAIWYLVLRKP